MIQKYPPASTSYLLLRRCLIPKGYIIQNTPTGTNGTMHIRAPSNHWLSCKSEKRVAYTEWKKRDQRLAQNGGSRHQKHECSCKDFLQPKQLLTSRSGRPKTIDKATSLQRAGGTLPHLRLWFTLPLTHGWSCGVSLLPH